MSKLSNMFKMLLLLENGRKYSAKELAAELEVSERMVRTYKDELEIAGIYIDTVKGKYGGYVLNDDLTGINAGLSKKDIGILELTQEFVDDNSEFRFKKDLASILQKIKKSYEKSTSFNGTKYYGDLDSGKTSEKHESFSKAIESKNKIKIWYVSFTTKIRMRVIHPIKLIKYKTSWFLLAFCETKGELRQFKYDRIIKYELLDEKYDEIDIICE